MIRTYFRFQVLFTPKLFVLTSKLKSRKIRFFLYFIIILITFPYVLIRASKFLLYNPKKPFSTKFGVLFLLPLYSKDTIQTHIFVSKNFFEYEILSFLKENYIKSNSVILDIGANIGNHSIFFATQCNVSEVYSFEPIKETYLMLKNNIEINNLSSLIKPYNYGVSDGKGYASIDEVPKNNIGGTSIKKDNTGNIELVSIDSFLNLKQLDFIKIDVESFEISVLLGLKETLKKFMPTILIEIFESNFTAANKILIDLGYKIVNEFEGSNYLYINSYTA